MNTSRADSPRERSPWARTAIVRFDDPAKPSAWQYGWTTDSRRLFFVINDWQSDIYVAELHGMR